MNREKTAMFAGHSTLYEAQKNLIDIIKNHIRDLAKKGYDVFLCGGIGAFDVISARAVYELKNELPHIKNILVLPYPDFNYLHKEYYDETIYPECLDFCPRKAAIPKRNRYMADISSVIICYVRYSFGGSGKTLEYAKSKKLEVINIV